MEVIKLTCDLHNIVILLVMIAGQLELILWFQTWVKTTVTQQVVNSLQFQDSVLMGQMSESWSMANHAKYKNLKATKLHVLRARLNFSLNLDINLDRPV